jgi:very-short-patch-repair endonuclease
VHRSRDLLAVDVQRDAALPVTTPSRSLIDAAPRLTSTQLEAALDAACRTGLISAPYLCWRVDELRRQGRRGIGKIAELVPADAPSGREESWLERRFTRLLRDAGLPPPRCQRRLRHSGGSARVDFVYDEAKLVIETDGHATHATRRRRQADAERDARLVAEGWRVVRFTYEDIVERPAYVVATVRSLLGLPA